MSFAKAFDRIFTEILGPDWRARAEEPRRGHVPPRPMPPPAPPRGVQLNNIPKPALWPAPTALEKPRIRLEGGLWVCGTSDGRQGFGPSPAKAYRWWVSKAFQLVRDST